MDDDQFVSSLDEEEEKETLKNHQNGSAEEGDQLDEHSEFMDQTSSLMSSIKVNDEEESDRHVKDLYVVVSDPEKHAGGYVSYNVNTKTTRGQFDHPEYNVRRRYQDFLWLRQRLQESYQTHIIPPLPEKHSFTKHFDRFSPEFLKAREHSLNKFMQRIADHPVISFNENLHIFLTAKSWELTSVKKSGPGLMSRMGDSMRNMASSWMLKSRDPDFQEMADYTKTFREKMTAMENISDRIAKDRFDLLEDITEFIPIFRLWANSESKLADPLTAMADALEKNSSSLKTLLRAQDPNFMEPLREYVLYTDAIKSALKSRDSVQMEYEVTLEELNRKRAEREELDKPASGGGGGRFSSLFSKDTEQSRQERREKLDANIDELSKLVETGHDRMECANVDLKADIERWHKNKKQDFRELFTDYADRHVAYHDECLKAWQTVLQQLIGQEHEEDNDDHKDE
ncbi:sorting nexin-7 [Exaiptasia diaphana]|uniref:PX domain-containing protein n=1 Tax=Exaiptasia diaphana TaxID=2652724 RepID=A0A913YD03_EXADI|nr:sorting nexin-7 [Exaiptasia diaphana]KXJ19222.1 Sorting nexin-30 [Exaiptasia diaphana]